MSEKNISQQFRLKNIDETKNYLVEEINQNELMSKKHKNVYRAYSSLVGIPIGITSTAIGLKIWAIVAGIKMCKLIIKKRKKNHDKILSSAKSKLNSVEVLISKALIDSNFRHNTVNSFYLIMYQNNLISWKKKLRI